MRSLLFKLILCGVVTSASVLPLVACSADIHGNSVDVNASATITTSIDVSNVQPGQAVPVHVATANVYLVDPGTTPPPDHVSDAAYLQFYVDSTDDQPILITAQADVSVTIPSSTPPGKHKLLCQVYKHDGTPTTTTSEIDFSVQASVTVGITDAGAGGG
jgi:hypothetical protein